MPLLSAFTMCGHLRMSGAPSRGETFYRILCDQLKNAWDLSQGTHAEALVYAMSMMLARASNDLERAGNQGKPTKAYDLIPLLEQDYLITPGPNATVPERAAAIVARMLLSRGATNENITSGLSALLGGDFIGYRPCPYTESFSYPVTWTSGGTNKANPTSTNAPTKLFQLIDPVATAGATRVRYVNLDPTTAEMELTVGDVMVQPENSGLSERVTITNVVAGTGSDRAFDAFFTNSHDVGAIVTTGNWPYWWSTKRRALVVVTASAAIDPEKRRIVDEYMARVARGVSQWSIVDGTSDLGFIGPLVVGAPLGVATVDQLTFP